jgi:hypothetical protein
MALGDQTWWVSYREKLEQVARTAGAVESGDD